MRFIFMVLGVLFVINGTMVAFSDDYTTVIHQIYVAVEFVIATLCFGFYSILSVLSPTKKKIETDN